MNKREKIGILGYGEIGKAVAKFYSKENLKIKDLNRDDGLESVNVLHICIPWSDKFVKISEEEIKLSKPRLVIIHSTVVPKTTKQLANKLKSSMIVHSPVRGIHPYLYKGIKTFVKYIGAEDKKSGNAAKDHLEKLNIKVKFFMPAVTTEIGKLLDTTYYGLCIAWHGEMEKMCRKYKIDFGKVVTDFNETYNQGYKKLGLANVIRPVLYPPKEGIGGHCVTPNAEILGKIFKSEALNLILKYKKK